SIIVSESSWWAHRVPGMIPGGTMWGSEALRSGLPALEEGHFEDALVQDRPVSEVIAFAEALAVIGGDDEVSSRRAPLQQIVQDAVDVFDAPNLLVMQGGHFLGREELGLLVTCRITRSGDRLVHALDHAV